MSTRRGGSTQVAASIPFDNTGTNFSGETVREVLLESGVSASPGFSWGRASNVNTGTWLLNDSVPSNKSGRTVNLSNPSIKAISISAEDISTFDITIYEHEGDSINLTSLGTVNIVNARSFSTTLNFPVTSGKQLAVRLTSGSAKNVVVGLQLSGAVS